MKIGILAKRNVICLEITEKMKKDLIQLIQDCDDYVDANIVPPKPIGIKAKICQYCIYRSQCRKD